MKNEEMTGIMDPRIPDDAVFTEGRFCLVRMPVWNKYNDNHEELIAIHECEQTGMSGLSMSSCFVAMPICDPCNFCGEIAPENLQTVMVLHNGHY